MGALPHAAKALALTPHYLPETTSLLSRPPHKGCLSLPPGEGTQSPNTVGRVAEWNIELQTFQLEFGTTRIIKGAALANFAAEWTNTPGREVSETVISHLDVPIGSSL